MALTSCLLDKSKTPTADAGVVFARVRFRKIRIALSIGILVAIRQTRISFRIRAIIAGYAAMRQRIAIGVADQFCSRGAPAGGNILSGRVVHVP